MRANEYQIGGSHYKTAYEHWSLVLKVKMPYLEGSATKYVTRWRKKGGVADLKKALHYLNKLEEHAEEAMLVGGFHGRPIYAELPYIRQQVAEFAKANDLSDLERGFVERLCVWQELTELAAARELLFLLMDEAEAQEIAEPDPVPLQEENHYSERAPRK